MSVLFMSLRRFVFVVMLGLIAAQMTSCLHMAETLGLVPKKPDIGLADFQIKSLSIDTIDVEVVIRVLNQDHRDLVVDDLSFDLFLSDIKLGSGATYEKVSLSPNAEQRVRVPISLRTKELMGAALNLMSGKTKEKARIRGSAHVKTWAGLLTIPFDREFGK